MTQDSISAYRIPQYLFEKQSIFFVKFIQQQDEDIYYNLYPFQSKIRLSTPSNKTLQLSNQKNYSEDRTLTTNQLLKSQTIKPIDLTIKHHTEDWFGISIIACILLFSLTRFFYYKRLGQVFSALFVTRVLSQINRESNLKKEGISFLLVLFFLISTSLFLYQVSINYFDFGRLEIKSSLTFFFIILLVLFFFYFIKLQLIRFVGYVFNSQSETNDYIIYNLLFLLVFGTLLLIPVIILSYISFKLGFYIAICFIVLSEGFRLFKAVTSLFSSPKFSVLFIFLYLCTIELIPILIIYKVLLNFIKT